MGALKADPDSAEGRRWLAGLSSELVGQRDLLWRLVELCAATPGASSLSVGCSLGRGAGDALSDVDAVLGVDAPRGAPGADQIRMVENAVVAAVCGGDVIVDVLRGLVEIRRGPGELLDRFANTFHVAA